jgi:Bacterial toxin 46
MSDVETIRTKLGLPGAPMVKDGLSTAVRFFNTVLRQDPQKWVGYLRGIDFHKPVRVERLPKGTQLIRYDSTGDRSLKPFLYFTKPGTSPHRLGTSFPSVEYKLFETTRPVEALVSAASAINFSPADRVSRPGGGTQYIVAFADAPALVRVGEKRG